MKMENAYQTVHQHKRKVLNGEDITSRKVIRLCEEFNRARAEKECSDKKGYIADLI